MDTTKRPPPSEPGTLADDPKSLTTVAAEDEGASVVGETLAANHTRLPKGVGNYRWVICALLFFATTINYVDRQILGILKPTLSESLGWSDTDYGNINVVFSGAYALSLLVFGGLIDRIGTRRGYTISLVVWSLAAMGHAAARSVATFSVARFALGLGEGGNFPTAIKTVAEWFPRRERALATGIFNAGSNVGAILAPLSVPWMTLKYGWPTAFLVTGAVGFVWLLFWLAIYRRPAEHPRVKPSELAYIQSDPPEATTKIPWARLLPHRQTWAFALGKLLTDPVWWFYLYWTADFLKSNYGIGLSKISLPLIVIYVVADFGSIGGGWLSSALIRRGWGVNRGRKTAMLVCALCVVPVTFAVQVHNLWAAVALISLAAAAHQGWSANLFTLTSDMFPRRAIGSVVGIGGMAGAVGAMVFSLYIGHILDWTHKNYVPIFCVCGFAYLIALGIIHLLAPKLQGPDLGEEDRGLKTHV